ncbi:MAG: hypothetical protein HXO45_02170 [Prevotella sp.]|uniref:hypothetical protein n=1 Tax=Prevotella sp. TaxID=59823 RepID=UPI001CAD9DF9|nr:hypothetical protein [Prevotella sp.]MBF1633236.1 hypothetical protein [Prevotella sp.]MBF1640027.1 hypothetical protein [Prevotella sp.]
MEQLLCQFQCSVQTVTAATLTHTIGIFSAFILWATAVMFIKESGKGWIKMKASMIANRLTSDKTSFVKTMNKISNPQEVSKHSR